MIHKEPCSLLILCIMNPLLMRIALNWKLVIGTSLKHEKIHFGIGTPSSCVVQWLTQTSNELFLWEKQQPAHFTKPKPKSRGRESLELLLLHGVPLSQSWLNTERLSRPAIESMGGTKTRRPWGRGLAVIHVNNTHLKLSLSIIESGILWKNPQIISPLLQRVIKRQFS